MLLAHDPRGLLGMNEAPPSLQVEGDSEAGHRGRDAWQQLALKPPLLTKKSSRDLGRREDAVERAAQEREVWWGEQREDEKEDGTCLALITLKSPSGRRFKRWDRKGF